MSSDRGYATIAVTALMSALSLLAASYLHLSVAEAGKSDAIASGVRGDILLEGALNEVIAGILNKDDLYTADKTLRLDYVGARYQVMIETESAKTDLNRAALDDIRIEVLTLPWLSEFRSEFMGRIERERASTEIAFESMSDLLKLEEDPGLYHCLRAHFTVYHSSAIQPGGRAAGSNPFPDGSILRIETRTLPPEPPRTLDVTLLLTGKRDEPFWVMDWQRYSGNRGEASCIV